MIRTCIVISLIFLAGCLPESEPCRADSCLALRSFTISDTAVETTDVDTWYVELTQRTDDENPLVLRLECTADGDLGACVKSFTMPDLPRLPTGGATLLKADSSTEAFEGSFRLTEVTLLSDGASYRVSGRVDVLRFQTDDEMIQIDEGTFDLLSTRSAQ